MSISKYRLVISEYFDNLVSEIDFQTETAIRKNNQDDLRTKELNQRREIYLKAIRESEQVNLKHLNEILALSLEALKDLKDQALIESLLSEFCYFIRYKRIYRLIITDKFYTSKQMKKFELALKISTIPERKKKLALVERLLEYRLVYCEVNLRHIFV
jgi:hypothetical protein